MNKRGDRFGTPESAIRREEWRHSGLFRSGLYVPTRHDVATLPIEKLKPILIDWFWESPTELIPPNEQVLEVREELLRRHDDVRALVVECDLYLDV